MSTKFDSSFWEATLTSLSYPIKPETLDVSTLKETKAVPRDFALRSVARLYQDSYTEIVILCVEEVTKLSRSVCTRTARMWRQNRMKRPLLLFTNGKESYAVIVPGTRTDGQTKILWLSENLYHTDRLVLDSLRFPGSPDTLRQSYDSTFFPYDRVRSEFFSGYRDLYAKIEKAVHKQLKKDSTSYAQRFLGRLMFLYFLQRKGWLKNDKQFINSIGGYRELNELFYESLNKEGTPGIPFLNGSLFEREDYMTAGLEKELLKQMDSLFQEARSFFNNYNFTVDEASPLELEVSVDPALIGTVFENMLPEHERGSKGTFYTPASESSFICRRAFANYLGYPDQISDDKQHFNDGLRLYLEKLRELKSEKDVRDFREKLLGTVILDPAVGSGGFLLVAMQEIILLIQEAEATVGWKSDPEEHKKRILPNLYGFDIEGEAIEIARLRLWLSLIIDQKEPEPLPNLDMNLVAIPDSLRLPDVQATLDLEDLRSTFHDLKQKYLNEHDARAKKRLRDQLNKIRLDLADKTGTDPFVIEAFMSMKPNVVVMNPPYVRQEGISETTKSYYTAHYRLDKKSDLYAYFLSRAWELLSDGGVVSAISSDKWLETAYGISLQEKLKDYLISIYGQRERTFGADINTVISVYSKSAKVSPIHFTYLESYSSAKVRQDLSFEKKDLKPGKWFYLRPAIYFMKTLRPSLYCKLRDFAVVKFGIKTGANEFFFVKDVSQLYEADKLSDPQKFKDWNVNFKTRKELEGHGLLYVENQGGDRFTIERKDISPIIRSPTELDSFIISRTNWYVFSPDSKPGPYSMRYIRWGESKQIEIKKGSKKGKKVIGFNNLTSVKSHRPNWFNVAELKPAPIIANKFVHSRHFVSLCEKPVLADHTCDLVYPKGGISSFDLWLCLNSTIFILVKELFGLRMGGGGAALQMLTEEYSEFPFPDVTKLKTNSKLTSSFHRKPMNYEEELKSADRRELDLEVLRSMGFDKPGEMIAELYQRTQEAIEDRLVKGAYPIDLQI